MPNARIRGGRPNMMKGGTGYSVYHEIIDDADCLCGVWDSDGNCACGYANVPMSQGGGGMGGNLMSIGACVRCGEEAGEALAGNNPGFTGANSPNCRTCGSYLSQTL